MTDVTYLTAEIVAAAAGNEHSRMRPDELVDLIKSVRAAMMETDAPAAAPTPTKAPSMSKAQWSKLITPSGIKSLLDGKTYKTLKRHLSRHGHDPASYREAHGLPADFPIVAPEYSAARSAMAKSLGLGARRKAAPETAKKAPRKAKA